MGSGASTKHSRALGSPGKSNLSRELSSRATVEGSKDRKLGPEYSVVLLSPQLTGVQLKETYILRIGYEALILCTPDAAKTPLAYFKYQDIICWGSTSALFQFKMFGSVFDKPRGDHIVILFSTKEGKVLEKTTLSSVYMLMDDMEKTAVLKPDFVKLKELLQKSSAPDAAVVNGANEYEVSDIHRNHVVGGEDANGDARESSYPAGEPPASSDGGALAHRKDRDPAAEIRPGADLQGQAGLLGGEGAGEYTRAAAFFATLKQFAASRCFTVHQGMDLMKLSRQHRILDSFEEMELAVWLWDNTLNRDSFQLIVNLFEDEGDRENLIFRIQSSGSKDKASAGLLQCNAPTAGGGLTISTASATSTG